MVGEFSPALSSRLHGRAGPPHTTLTTRRPEGRHHLGDVHHKEASTSRRLALEPHQREPHEHHTRQARNRRRPRSPKGSKQRTSTSNKQARRRNWPPPRKRQKTWRLMRPYIPPIQRLAPPSLSLRPPSSPCGNVPEGGRAFVPTFAPIHQSGVSCLALPFTPSAEKIGGRIRRKKSAHHEGLLLFPFHSRSRTVFDAERVVTWLEEKRNRPLA